MKAAEHPNAALFAGERRFPIIAACDHYAGSEKLITKALALQAEQPIFDVTMDCEDGAAAGHEKDHARRVAELLRSDLNTKRQAGVRIHDPAHAAWRQDLEILVPAAGEVLSHVTLPKTTCVEQVREMIAHLRHLCAKHSLRRELPVHVLIETHGALRDVWAIAALPWVRVLDFGLMDFVSGHHGAIPSACMKSPGQFEHALIRRAKTEIAAAALAHGCVPAHNVTLELKDAARTFDDAKRAHDEFGYLRMWSIHPAQIEPIVRAMAPSFAEVHKSTAVLLAAQHAQWGPIAHEGELHDRATYRYFWEVVQRARLSGQRLPDEAEAAWFAQPPMAAS